MKKGWSFPKHGAGTNEYSYAKNVSPFESHATSKNYFKMDHGLNIKPKICIKFPTENIGENSSWTWVKQRFLKSVWRSWFIKSKTDKLEFIKIKNCSLKDSVKRMKGKAEDWKKNIWWRTPIQNM